ncbi:MAG: UDP-N-acetylmuramoylalanine/D-glutamate ligase, partial [Bacteroidetes bacterium]|nr:UDP-N-acetylmuramoylalanine/D-glutamate ligase [Bacteroidota bacterium]
MIGAARSGIAVARLLKARGAEVFVSDHAPTGKMQPVIAELEKLHVAYEFGGNTLKILDADVVVLSPGVPSDSRIVVQAKAAGRSVVSEIEAASWFCPGPIVAITGTNGKTTTTTLVGRIFEDAKEPAMVAGNIGLAFSQVVDQVTEQSTAILEVSSFQLDHIETFRPKVAVWLNVTPDHLDRYEHTYEKYIAAKCRVFENQRRGDTLVYNADDEVETAHVQQRINAEVTLLPFSTRKQLELGAFVDQGMVKTRVRGRESDVIPVKDISIPG